MLWSSVMKWYRLCNPHGRLALKRLPDRQAGSCRVSDTRCNNGYETRLKMYGHLLTAATLTHQACLAKTRQSKTRIFTRLEWWIGLQSTSGVSRKECWCGRFCWESVLPCTECGWLLCYSSIGGKKAEIPHYSGLCLLTNAIQFATQTIHYKISSNWTE